MDESILLRRMEQVSSSDADAVFREYVRACVRETLTDAVGANVAGATLTSP